MLRLLLPLVFVFSVQHLVAQPQPEPLKGLLWEVSGNGIAKKGYLYGTMHVPEKLAFNLSDSFFVTLRAVDVVALETDHDRWQAFTELLDGRESEIFGGFGAMYGDGYTPGQPNIYHEQFNFSVPENRTLGSLLSAKPRLTNEFLYRTNQYRQDHEEDTYLDLFIFQAGRKLGKSVIGLETLEGSFEAMIRAQLPDEEEEQEGYERRYSSGSFSRATMEDAYRDQDLALLDSISRMAQPGKNFRRWMLDERNYIMANGIDSILKSGSALFAAVGAAHLPGETGLIPLLREKGYAVRPVQFSASVAKQEKEAIEALRYPVQFSRQWAADSVWSADAPGKFYQTIDDTGFEQYLCADMNNGAYYAVYRLRTYGLWNGQSPEYIAQRMDSLLYEKVPGKILERRRLTGPIPGHEITSRTRRGDILRFKILVLPMDIYVFAAGGNGDYAAGEEAARFMRSIQFRQGRAEHQPTVVQPPQSGFRVAFPAEPMLDAALDKKSGRQMMAAIDPADSAFYLVFRGVYHDWNYIEEDTFELNIIGEKIAEQFTKSAPQVTWITTAPYPTHDVVFRSDRDSAWYFLRLVIQGPRYYLLGCRKSTPDVPEAFFDSFALEPGITEPTWEVLRDTAMQFEVLTPPMPEPPGNAFVENLRNIVQEGMKNSKYGSSPQPRRSRILRVPRHGEAVFVFSAEVAPGGLAPTLDSFQTFFRLRETDNGKMAVREQRWDSPSDRLLIGDLVLEDTNSLRGIRTRVLLTPGRMYTLSATVHLDAPPSAMLDKIFDSFAPTDTTTGTLPFGERNQDFLKEMYAEDSLVREKALDKLTWSWQLALTARDFPGVRQAIEHPKFGQLRFKHRKTLLGTLSRFPTPEGLAFANSIWQRYPDSMRYQQVLLIALAEMQTRPAQDAVVRLLKQDKVFVSNSTTSEIFSAFQDSIELSARLLPALMAIAEMRPECREFIISMIEQAADKGLVKPSAYARLKPRLLFGAHQELGAMQARTEVKAEPTTSDYFSDDYGLQYRSNVGAEQSLRLLVPFLSKDKAVQRLFDRATRCSNKTIQILAYTLMQQKGLPVPKDTLRGYADNDKTRYLLYRQLAETDQLAAYASWFSDTTALVRSILYDDLSGSERNDNGLDSVRFLSQHHTLYNKRPGMTYFFEIKKKKEKDWCLAQVKIPLSASVFAVPDKLKNPQGYYADDAYRRPEVRVLTDLSEKEKAEYIEKQVGAVRFADRQRYQHWNNRDEGLLFDWEEE